MRIDKQIKQKEKGTVLQPILVIEVFICHAVFGTSQFPSKKTTITQGI